MTLFFYRILILIFIPLAFLRLIFKSFSNKDLLCHWRERFGFCALEGLKNKKLIWIHAVSVGETNAINPLVSKILKEHKDVNLLITHGTLTGRQTPLKSSTRIIRRYLPYDNSWMMKKFLSNYSPDIGLIVETEIWPNLFFESKKKKIPLFLINGRLSKKSLQKYLLIKRFTQQVLNCVETLYVQTLADKTNFLQLTNKNINVIGNTKFDFPVPRNINGASLSLRKAFGFSKKFVLLAASTRDGEEEEVLSFVKDLNLLNSLLIIVPRHPQRFDKIEDLIKKYSLNYARKSRDQKKISTPSVILGDTMGEMYMYYNLADFVILGGSIKNYGSQNPIEALALDKPIAIGPSIYNFQSIIEEGTQKGVFYRFEKLESLKPIIKKLYTEKSDGSLKRQRKKFLNSNRGASDRLIKIINQYL